MTAPGNPPDPPGPWPDVLAAHADGELDARAHATVERRLAADPVLRAELRAQVELSPANWRLWQRAEPPLPSEDAWAAVRDNIAAGLTTPPTPAVRREPAWRRRTAVYFAGGVAAAVAAFVIVPLLAPKQVVVPVPTPFVQNDPLAGLAVLALAGEDDVDVHRTAGTGAGWLPVGGPLPGALVLAGEADVDVEEAEPHPAWPAGGPKTTTAPGDAPMIFAATRR